MFTLQNKKCRHNKVSIEMNKNVGSVLLKTKEIAIFMIPEPETAPVLDRT